MDTIAGFTLTAVLHQDCGVCQAQATEAVTAARITGSTGATHTLSASSGLHSATVARG